MITSVLYTLNTCVPHSETWNGSYSDLSLKLKDKKGIHAFSKRPNSLNRLYPSHLNIAVENLKAMQKDNFPSF